MPSREVPLYAHEQPDRPAGRDRHRRPPTVPPSFPASLAVPPGRSVTATATAAQMLALQRAAGNTAVSRLVAENRPPLRDPEPAGSGRPLTVQRANSYTDEPASLSYYHPKVETDPAPYHATDVTIRRPQQVTGTISPISTKGRPAAPNPWVVVKLFEAYRAARTNAEQASGKRYPHLSADDIWRDLMGGAGYDRGHIMGLELGGDDISENIVPQWSLNQQSGPWREQEKAVLSAKGATVSYTVNYASDYGPWRAVMIPTDIEFSVSSGTVTTWDNAPDHNDHVRAGTDPGNLQELYEFVKTRAPSGTTCTAAQMDAHAFAALADEMALIKDQELYYEAGGSAAAPVSQHDTILAGITKSQIEKRKRDRLIKEFVTAGLVAKSGNTYTIL